MTELEKAARQAREYLNGLIRGLRMNDDSRAVQVLTAIDAALEQQLDEEPPIIAELNCVCGAVWEWRNRDWEIVESPQPAAQITDEQIQDLLKCGNPTDEEQRLIRLGYAAAQPAMSDKRMNEEPIAGQIRVPIQGGYSEWSELDVKHVNREFKEGVQTRYLYARPQPAAQPPKFPTMLRKMWSGEEVQKWINENWSKP